MENEQAQNLECWAIVDLFGHQRIAGKLTTQSLGVAALIRIDVPEVTIPEKQEGYWDDNGPSVRRRLRVIPPHKKGGYTRYFGPGAIYSISPVSEELARAAVMQIDAEPVKPYELPERPKLTSGSSEVGSRESGEQEETEPCQQCGGDLVRGTGGGQACKDCGETASEVPF